MLLPLTKYTFSGGWRQAIACSFEKYFICDNRESLKSVQTSNYILFSVFQPETRPVNLHLYLNLFQNKHCGRIGSCTSFAKGSIMNNPAVTAQPSFLTIASYKGSLVVVKGFRKRHVEINRAVKKELYYIKEMSHDNINRFIGACLDQPTVCIVTQYCTRGSLKVTTTTSSPVT